MNTAEQIQERRAEGEDRSPVILTKRDRETIHAEGFFVEHLRELQKKLCCLECIAVVGEEIDRFMEFTGRSK